MGAVRYRFGADRRAHWRGWVLRGLLFGVAAATVLTAVAAARRTDTAYDRFLVAQDAYDVVRPNQEDSGTAVLDPHDVGVVAGRAAWTFLADQPGVVPAPIVPVVPLLLAVPAALAVGLVVALIPGRIAARTPAANVSRAG